MRSVGLPCRFVTRLSIAIDNSCEQFHARRESARASQPHQQGRLPESLRFHQRWRVRRSRKSCCGHSKVCTVVSEVQEKFEVESLGEAIRESATGGGQRRAAGTPTVAKNPQPPELLPATHSGEEERRLMNSFLTRR